MPTTAYAVTITPPVAGGFYVPVEVRFEHAAAPAAEPNPNPAYLVRDGSTPLQGRTLISDVTTFYFVATTAVLLSTWAGGDDQSKQSVTPAAYATPTAVALGPTSSGTPSADLSSRFAQTVTHGSNAATARSGTGPLTWIGSVDPSNAADGDYLLRTDLQRFYARVSSAWMEMSPYQPATYKDSWYCTPLLLTASTAAYGDGIASFVPVWFPKGYTVTKLGVQVTSGGTSGSVMRFGIYDDVKGTPTNLIVDAGTVATTGTGFNEVTLSQTIPTTGWYYLVVVPQGAAATPPTIRCGKPTNTFATHPTAANILDGNQRISKYKTGVTAALPSLLDGIAADTGNYTATIAFAGTNP